MSTIFDIFKSITRFDIESYFDEFSSFILSDYQKIVDYNQKGSVLSSSVIVRLNDLLSSMNQLNDLFSVYEDRLSSDTTEIWEVLDSFESTKVTLLTVINSDRWLRSTKTVLQSDSVMSDYVLRQGQTFEQLSGDLGYTDPTNNWAEVAINNDIREEDYSFEGGSKLKITFVNNMNFFVNSVIDNISGEKVYGKDISRVFVLENQDLRTLSYRDTLLQQTGILVGLVKGSVPEFPLDGISKDLIGGNVNAIQYPVILRQQSAVFEKDDRYKSVLVNNLETKEDSLIVDLQITTRLDEVLDQQLILQ